MSEIKSQYDAGADEAKSNAGYLRGLVDDLKQQISTISEGGGEKARKKHLDRGKLLPRERIRALLDPGSPFLELSSLAAHGMYEGRPPAPGSLPVSAGLTDRK